jgi:surface carbohydrate biosynthesis protein
MLLLPIELFRREIDTRLLLALFALERGYSVLLGYLSDQAFREAPPGTLLYKSHNQSVADYCRAWLKQGHVCTALDEEGLLYASEQQYATRRISEDVCDHMQKLFTWGHEQINLFPKKYWKKIVPTGHLKFDLLRLAASPDMNKGRDCKSILFNTRFPSIAGFHPSAQSPEYVDNERAIFEFFEAAVRMVSQLPGVWVRIRPHPAEDPCFYERKFSNVENLYLEPNRNLLEAFRDSDAVVHDSCTTAIEAAVYGLPVFGLRPTGLDDHYNTIANQVSENFNSPEELVRRVESLLDGNLPEGGQQGCLQVLKGKITNLEGPLACERILDALDRCAPSSCRIADSTTRFSQSRHSAMGFLRKAIPVKTNSVRNQKFSELLSSTDIKQRLIDLNNNLAAPFHLQDTSIRQVSRRAFLIQQSS